ncbi:MAG: hypothetical protein V1909_00900 [Candidatus Micrarchaeota archaeon]
MYKSRTDFRELNAKLERLKVIALWPSSGVSPVEQEKLLAILNYAIKSKTEWVKQSTIRTISKILLGNGPFRMGPLLEPPMLSSVEICGAANAESPTKPGRYLRASGFDIGGMHFDNFVSDKPHRIIVQRYSEDGYGEDKEDAYSEPKLIKLGEREFIYNYMDNEQTIPKLIGAIARDFKTSELADEAASRSSGELFPLSISGRFVIIRLLEPSEEMNAEILLRAKLKSSQNNPE